MVKHFATDEPRMELSTLAYSSNVRTLSPNWNAASRRGYRMRSITPSPPFCDDAALPEVHAGCSRIDAVAVAWIGAHSAWGTGCDGSLPRSGHRHPSIAVTGGGHLSPFRRSLDRGKPRRASLSAYPRLVGDDLAAPLKVYQRYHLIGFAIRDREHHLKLDNVRSIMPICDTLNCRNPSITHSGRCS